MIGTFMHVTAPSVAYIEEVIRDTSNPSVKNIVVFEEVIRNTSNQKGILALRNLSFECKMMLENLDKLTFESKPKDLTPFHGSVGNYRRALLGRDVKGFSDEENRSMRIYASNPDIEIEYVCKSIEREGQLYNVSLSEKASKIISFIYSKKKFIEKIIKIIDAKDNIYLKFCNTSTKLIDNETNLNVYKYSSKLSPQDIIIEVRSYVRNITNKRSLLDTSEGGTSIGRLLDIIYKNQNDNKFTPPKPYSDTFIDVPVSVSGELEELGIYGVHRNLSNLKAYVEPFAVLNEVGSPSGLQKMENVLVNAISKELRGA